MALRLSDYLLRFGSRPPDSRFCFCIIAGDHCFVVFFYDIFPESKTILGDLHVTLHYLATSWDVLAAAKQSGQFDAGMLAEVEAFMRDPNGWSKAHGGTVAAE